MLGRRQTTDGEDPLDSRNGVVGGVDLRRAHMELAQPNRRMVGIERHGAIVQDAHGKAKPARERAVCAAGWRSARTRKYTVTKRYLAHVRRNEDGSFAIHDLEEHLRGVADLAGEFASSFGHADWGRLAGLWHDLGK